MEKRKKNLYQKSNAEFLGAIEMFVQFDPIMKEHMRHTTNDVIYVHYHGRTIQNELIFSLSHEFK